MARQDITPNDIIVKTSVNLYKSDVDNLTKRGFSISDTVRDLLHHISSYGDEEIFFSVRRSGGLSILEITENKIKEIEEKISELKTTKSEFVQRRNLILKNLDVVQSQEKEYLDWQSVTELGYAIDTVMFHSNFDPDIIRGSVGPEIEKMENLNPGWNLEQYIEMKKKLLGITQ